MVGSGVTIIYVLLVAHFIADFVCQSDWIATNKAKRWDALAFHVGIYISVVAVIVAAFQPPSPYPYVELWQFGAWTCANSAAHFVQDAITSRITARLWFFAPEVQSAGNPVTWNGCKCFTARGGNRHWFFVAIGADQLLHYITLFVTAGWWLK